MGDGLRKVWWLVESLLMWFHVCVVVNCAMLWKWSSSHYLCEHVIALFWGMVVEVLCELRKNDNLKRMYHFEGRIARRDGYYIFRGTYRAPRWLLISRVVSCTVKDAWTDMSPMGHGLRDSGCVSLGQTCIIILDIAFHCIAHTYYWWTWTRVLLILWVFLCEACDCWVLSCYWECVNW